MSKPHNVRAGGLPTLLVGCAATLFIASRLWMASREMVHLRMEVEAAHATAEAAVKLQQQAAQERLDASPAASDEPLPAADPVVGDQPLLFYSIRSVQPLGPEPPPLTGARLADDPLPIQHDPDGKLVGQVNMVEAGRVHGWACLKATPRADLTVSVFVDGVHSGSAQAVLPTQSSLILRLCQMPEEGADGGSGLVYSSNNGGSGSSSGEAADAQRNAAGGGGGGAAVGFVAPLPPLPQGIHTLRVFVHAPGGGFKQELNQSPLLFRESTVSPDSEERIRRKDAIITTRNAQVAQLWDELHTRQPWRNAVGSGGPVRPFPEEAEADLRQREKSGNDTDLVLYIGVNTGLTSRSRRDILRRTWVPTGAGLGDLEQRLGVRIRFFIGYSQKKGDAVEKELQAEMKQYGDIIRLDLVDEYNELSRKTGRLFSYMSTTVAADFYFKIDDDVAVNVEALADYLRERRSQGNLYLGCMKSGEVLTDKRWKWYEPEHWRFGDPAGKDDKVNYMRHASGQIYGMSRPVARYIAQNEAILHRYANEDVGVGAWLIGLDIQYDNQRRLCCDTEWKCTQQSSKDNVCLAFSENQCAGLCRSEERLEGIYRDCVVDPYSAGKKGKLPWWGSSGWATSSKA